MLKVKLEFSEDETLNYQQALNKDVLSLGRLPTNDIVLPYPGVSRRHAEIRKTADGWFLKDLGSANGTFVNGVLTHGCRLHPDDKIQIKTVTLTLFSSSTPSDSQFESVKEDTHRIMAEIDSSLYQKETSGWLMPGHLGPPSGQDVNLFKKNNKILYVLYHMSQKINQSSDFDTLLATIMDLVFDVVEVDYGFIATVGEQPGELVPKVIKYRDPPEQPSKTIQVSSHVFKKVIEQQTSILTSNVNQDLQGAESIVVQNIHSILSVPLWQDEKVIGLIQLNNFRTTKIFIKQDLELLYAISSQVSMVIEQANLTERVQLTESLHQALEEIQQKNEQLTERHRQLQETQSQLVQSEKMASLGTLVAGVSHEINNPLNFVHAGTYILKNRLNEFKTMLFGLLEETSEGEIGQSFETQFNELHKQLSTIEQGEQRIQSIVNDLKVFSRLDEAEQKAVHLVESLQATLRLVKTKGQASIQFIEEFKSDPLIECWPAQLNQLFMNVMLNACYAIQEKNQHCNGLADGTLTIGTFIKDDDLAIVFRDTGCGMTEEVKKTMFDPFFTTKTVGEGIGLGLSIAYGIIKKHQGRIEVVSELDEGTTVTIFLPL